LISSNLTISKGLEGQGSFQIVGSIIVLASIVGMSFSDWFETKKFCDRKAKVKVFKDLENGNQNEKLNCLLDVERT